MNLIFRDFTDDDLASCLEIFDSNTPKFFLPHERTDFLSHFEEPQIYFVLEQNSTVVACGGLAQIRNGVWVLCYGMVHRDFHKQGIGTVLLEKRLEWLRAQPQARELHLDTSQHSRGFFARFGFIERSFAKDGYGEGLDRFDMVLEFNGK